MSKIIFGIFTAIIMTCCTNKIQDDPDKIDGVYEGTFSRIPAWQLPQTAKISITFTDSTWSGHSDTQNFPVLGEGTYKIENDLLIFTNQSEITPETDTTLILSGEFQFNKSNKGIEIYRYSYGWGWEMPDEDRYTITRK